MELYHMSRRSEITILPKYIVYFNQAKGTLFTTKEMKSFAGEDICVVKVYKICKKNITKTRKIKLSIYTLMKFLLIFILY